MRTQTTVLATIVVLCICTIANAKYSGSIIGWGAQVVDSTELDQKNHIAISAGVYHSLALKSDGSIVGWGNNDYGQVTPPDGNDFVAIAAGDHSLAIKYVCQYELAGDLNDDCRVNLLDFAKIAENWLIDCNIDPNNPACVPK